MFKRTLVDSERVREVLGLHYQMAWPGRQMETSRNIRSSALYETHKKNNAFFGETAGWERPFFFAPAGTEPTIKYSFIRQNWHDWVVEEHCGDQSQFCGTAK